jgi:hypothetical protein
VIGVIAPHLSTDLTMATQADVRRIALSLPGAEQGKDRFVFFVRDKGKPKGFAWVWLERLEARTARVPNPDVLAVRVANNAQKDLILASDTRKFFSEGHYDGYPAILVRLKEVTVADLRVLLEEAWRCRAPKELVETVSSDGAAAPKAAATRRSRAPSSRGRSR